MPLHLLVVSSETPDQQARRRALSGTASHETFAETLRKLDGTCIVAQANCIDGTRPAEGFAAYDGVLFAGSPIQMHGGGPEQRAAAAFAEAVFEAGTPSFGSCAGLQIAATAAGGTTKPRDAHMEAGFARGITRTPAGHGHPLLRGRPSVWDAPAMHSDVVDRLPPGGTTLAATPNTSVQVAEIRHRQGVFWGVQYHPEISIGEIADALRREAPSLVADELARNEGEVEAQAAILQRLDTHPDRDDLARRMGIGLDVIDPTRRTTELQNFLDHLRVQAVTRSGAA
ncbi:gamma-glutamyl-gamma-aminobutyrate hydrolase family protein [uncultured Jannaschia sp.]|uniref:type 1 glutamine amidotransferase n=1 Tax=uncultured Jannaschia sp. TaxID=293347 RepID=UPI00262213F8|nr:gamma-glutamyl-gamma-aminobutyrate hydrolase family protein [uncultured Jannaschia sp.]